MDTKTRRMAWILRHRVDTWVNSLTGFGGRKDPLQQTAWQAGQVVTQLEAELMFEHNWAFRKIVEIIPEDAMREGIALSIPDDDDLIADVNERMESLHIMVVIEQAFIQARINGGAVILLGAIDGEDPEMPLNEDDIETIKFANIFNRWEIFPVRFFTDPLDANFSLPEIYRVNPPSFAGTIQNQGRMIHASRVIRFDGDYIPEKSRIKNQHWHASILQELREPLKNFGVSCSSAAILLQDFITKVLKSPSMVALMTGDSEDIKDLETRIQLTMSHMSSLGFVLTGEDEEFGKIQTPIKGLAEIMGKFEEYLAAPSGIPRTRFFGQQLGKLAGATETGNEYRDKIRSIQIKKLQPQIKRILSLFLKAKDGINGGAEPDVWSFEFNPLIQESTEQKTLNRKVQAETDTMYLGTGVLTPEEVATSRFGPDGSLEETTVDLTVRRVTKEFEGEFGDDPSKKKSAEEETE